MKKISELFNKAKELFKTKKYLTVICAIGVLAVIVCAIIAFFPRTNGTREDVVIAVETINVDQLTHVLETASELTSAKIHTTGVVEYVDKGVKFVNRADFTMLFKAEIRAGIDLDNVIQSITVDEVLKKVTITVPKAKILDVNVDPESIKYFDVGFSLFNPNEREDAAKAMALAKQKAEEDAPGTGILELADNHAETLIRGLVSDEIVGKKYKLDIIRK